MTKKIKIILSIFLIALVIGYTVLYHWAKNRFTELYQESKQQIQAEGWVIEETPLTFSGFPFRLTANQENATLTRTIQDKELVIEARNIKMHVSILNPFKYSFEGNITLVASPKGPASFKITLNDSGAISMGYRDNKLKPTSLKLHAMKAEAFTPEGKPSFTLQMKELGYEAEDHKITDSSDGKILQLGSELYIKDLEVLVEKDGASTPVVHLKKIKTNFKGKMPLALAEYLKTIFEPATSPMVQICQAGGKVPPLKDTFNLMEKVGSTGKVNIEIEHNNYVLNLDLDAKILNGGPELLLTTQVNNLNSLFDAFNLDPTMRLIANGFVKKESNQSEKAHLIVKLSAGSIFVNDMEIMKVPMPDWDNIVLPADVCSKYAAVTATKAATTTVPRVVPIASPL